MCAENETPRVFVPELEVVKFNIFFELVTCELLISVKELLGFL